MSDSKTKKKKLFAAASIGGHWMQLLRITTPLEERYEVVYASNHPRCATMIPGNNFYLISDFNRKNAWRLIPSLFRILCILRREHPAIVLTTGAAPGLVCVMAGWLLRYKTIWVDSVANTDQLSVSGRIARRIATRVYTQWPALAQSNIIYAGTVFGEEMKYEQSQTL